jgi:hypothetical protein
MYERSLSTDSHASISILLEMLSGNQSCVPLDSTLGYPVTVNCNSRIITPLYKIAVWLNLFVCCCFPSCSFPCHFFQIIQKVAEAKTYNFFGRCPYLVNNGLVLILRRSFLRKYMSWKSKEKMTCFIFLESVDPISPSKCPQCKSTFSPHPQRQTHQTTMADFHPSNNLHTSSTMRCWSFRTSCSCMVSTAFAGERMPKQLMRKEVWDGLCVGYSWA